MACQYQTPKVEGALSSKMLRMAEDFEASCR